MASPTSNKLFSEYDASHMQETLADVDRILGDFTKDQADAIFENVAKAKITSIYVSFISNHAIDGNLKSEVAHKDFANWIKYLSVPHHGSTAAKSRNSLELGKASVQVPKPPKGCQFVLACLAKRGRVDELLGDAEEDYRTMAKRFPLWAARWCFRLQVARTVIGMLPGLILRVLILRKLGL